MACCSGFASSSFYFIILPLALGWVLLHVPALNLVVIQILILVLVLRVPVLLFTVVLILSLGLFHALELAVISGLVCASGSCFRSGWWCFGSSYDDGSGSFYFSSSCFNFGHHSGAASGSPVLLSAIPVLIVDVL